MMREKEYKWAALKAKQEGDLEKAKEFMRTGKVRFKMFHMPWWFCTSQRVFLLRILNLKKSCSSEDEYNCCLICYWMHGN